MARAMDAMDEMNRAAVIVVNWNSGRIFKGVSPFAKDAEHFHHRLQKLGLTSINTICLLFGIGLYFDLSAMVPVFNINLIPNFIPVYFIFVIANVAGFIGWLRRLEKKHRHDHP